MPLIPQQDIVVAHAPAGGVQEAVDELKKKLLAYPAVRVVAIDIKPIVNPLGLGSLGHVATAVVETVNV